MKAKRIKTASLIAYFVGACLAISALIMLATAMSKIDWGTVDAYLGMIRQSMNPISEIEFTEALHLQDVIPTLVPSMWLMVGSVLSFAFSKALEAVYDYVERSRD